MTVQDFIFELPLYTRERVSGNTILEGLDYGNHIDGYNPIKGVDSTFCVEAGIDTRYNGTKGIVEVRLKCQRYMNYMFVMIHYNIEQDYIEKVGQYPSIADIHIAKVRKYKTVLGAPYIKDFTRAIGLAANGIGTGSFVYLRRIFEHLIEEISIDAIKNGEIDKEQYIAGSIEQKIILLSEHLPDVLTENKSLYAVLSAGIHSLSEETCLSYFPIVKTVVELILDEMEFEKSLAIKKKSAKEQLGRIVGEVRTSIKKSRDN